MVVKKKILQNRHNTIDHTANALQTLRAGKGIEVSVQDEKRLEEDVILHYCLRVCCLPAL